MLKRIQNIARGVVLPAVVVLALSGMAQTSSGQCELVELLASDGSQSDLFGSSVSISGGVGIIGARNDDANGYASGSAYIFVQDGLSWIEQAKLLASDGETYNYFGESVDVSGDVAIVGARWNDEIGFHAGAGGLDHQASETPHGHPPVSAHVEHLIIGPTIAQDEEVRLDHIVDRDVIA